jgi:hypothetical protein
MRPDPADMPGSPGVAVVANVRRASENVFLFTGLASAGEPSPAFLDRT